MDLMTLSALDVARPCLDNKSTQKKPDQQWVLTGHYKVVLRRAFGVSKSFRMPSKGLDYIAADPVAHGREYATPAATASVEDVDAVIAAVPSATPMISPAIDAAVILRQCGWIIITPPGGGGVIGPASPVAWGAHRWHGRNPLSQSQAQPLSLWSPPAGVLCLCHTQWVLCLCRPAPVEGGGGGGLISAPSACPAPATVKPDGAFNLIDTGPSALRF